jgi:hypothetical protein
MYGAEIEALVLGTNLGHIWHVQGWCIVRLLMQTK